MLDINSYFATVCRFCQLHIRFVFALAAAVGALLIGEHVYLKEYLTTDENSYLFQAWLFLHGDLSLECPALSKSFFHRMLICDEQVGWLSRYPPSHSIWLMPGVAIGYPRLMTAVAAFLSIWFITKAGERLNIKVWITGLLLLISPYFWLMQGSILSHTSGLAVTALMMWAYLVWLEDRKTSFAAIAGLAWAFLFLNRTFTAVLIALPFAIDVLIRLAYSRTLLNVVGTFIFASCAVSGVVVYFIYNYLTTGDPFIPTYLYYDPMDGLGFGKRHSIQYTVEHTPMLGWENIKFNLTTLNVRMYGFVGSLVALLGLTLIGWNKKMTPILLAATLLVWFGYGAFWFIGIPQVAPVYYYETLVFTTLCAGLGIVRLFNSNGQIPLYLKVAISVLIVMITGKYAIATFQDGANIIIKRNEYKSTYHQIIQDVPTDSIVILSRVHKDILAENSFNPHGLESDPLIVRDGYGVTHALYHQFPNRSVYIVGGHHPAPARLVENHNGEIPVIHAANMKITTGRHESDVEASYAIAQAPDDEIGKLGYNVHQYFIPGRYEVNFFFQAFGAEGENIGKVDVIAGFGSETLAERYLKSSETQITLDIKVNKVKIVEPRIHFTGKGRLVFERIEIRLIEAKS